ncbi:MAG: 50S ribosomal protein L33 [Planctomycetota bacterium]
MGSKKSKGAEVVYLVCEETGDYNYTIRKKLGGEAVKVEVMKFCPRLRRRTKHIEKKK